jgi:hypothetical protein
MMCHCFVEAVLFAEKSERHCFREAVAHGLSNSSPNRYMIVERSAKSTRKTGTPLSGGVRRPWTNSPRNPKLVMDMPHGNRVALALAIPTGGTGILPVFWPKHWRDASATLRQSRGYDTR